MSQSRPLREMNNIKKALLKSLEEKGVDGWVEAFEEVERTADPALVALFDEEEEVVGQSKTMSITENLCSVASGYLIAMCLWRFVVTPYLGIPVSYEVNMKITLLFTVVSVIRGYVWRRIFNGAWRGKRWE